MPAVVTEFQALGFIASDPATRVLGALDGAGAAVTLMAWSPVTGDVTHSAPAGTGSNTRVHRFDRPISSTSDLSLHQATGDSILTLGNASSASSGRLLFTTHNAQRNWQVASNYNGVYLEFTPSTAVGGAVFTTPTMTMTAGAVSVTGTLAISSTSTFANTLTMSANAAIRVTTSTGVTRALLGDSSVVYVWIDVDNVGTRLGAGVGIGGAPPTTGITVYSGTAALQAVTATTVTLTGGLFLPNVASIQLGTSYGTGQLALKNGVTTVTSFDVATSVWSFDAFTRICIGGVTAGEPALRRSGANLDIITANAGAYTNVRTNNVAFRGSLFESASSVGILNHDGATNTIVSAFGTNAATPGQFIVNLRSSDSSVNSNALVVSTSGVNMIGTALVIGGTNAQITSFAGYLLLAGTTDAYLRAGGTNVIYIGDATANIIDIGAGGGAVTYRTAGNVTVALDNTQHMGLRGGPSFTVENNASQTWTSGNYRGGVYVLTSNGNDFAAFLVDSSGGLLYPIYFPAAYVSNVLGTAAKVNIAMNGTTLTIENKSGGQRQFKLARVGG